MFGRLARKRSHPHALHAQVRPGATYSPWNQDQEFRAVYERLRAHTLVDIWRCHELWQLVAQSAKLSGGALLEVGVWRGGTGALIAQRAARCGISEPVYLCDTFTGVVKAGDKDTAYKGGEHADTSFAAVGALLADIGVHNAHLLPGIFPEQTAARIEAETFRFGHIDVDVYRSARDSFEWLWPRLLAGGIVVFDDYGFIGCDGVTRYVEELRALPGCAVLHNLNGHAVVIKWQGAAAPGA